MNTETSVLPRSIDVQQFAVSREGEILSLLNDSSKLLSSDAPFDKTYFQRHRRQLRRRTGSHNPYRRHRSKRPNSKFTIPSTTTTTTTTTKRQPDEQNRAMRRKPSSLKTKYINSCSWTEDNLKEKEKEEKEQAKEEKEETKQQPSSPSSPSSPPQHQQYKCLETHLWHVKRYKMKTTCGWNLPHHHHGRGKGAPHLVYSSYYNNNNNKIMMHDASYMCPMLVYSSSLSFFSSSSSSAGHGGCIPFKAAITHLSNITTSTGIERQLKSGALIKLMMYHRDDDGHQRIIGPIEITWISNDRSDGDTMGWLVIWAHPGIAQHVYERLVVVASMSCCSVKVAGSVRRIDMCVRGGGEKKREKKNHSTIVVQRVLGLDASFIDNTDDDNEDRERDGDRRQEQQQQQRRRQSCLIAATLTDPRLRKPMSIGSKIVVVGSLKEKEKRSLSSSSAADNNNNNNEAVVRALLQLANDDNDSVSTIKPPLPEREISSRRNLTRLRALSLLEKRDDGDGDGDGEGSYSEQYPLFAIKHYNPHNNDNNTTIWMSLILPSHWVNPVWHSLMERKSSGEVTVMGQDEWHLLHTLTKQLFYPHDYQDLIDCDGERYIPVAVTMLDKQKVLSNAEIMLHYYSNTAPEEEEGKEGGGTKPVVTATTATAAIMKKIGHITSPAQFQGRKIPSIGVVAAADWQQQQQQQQQQQSLGTYRLKLRNPGSSVLLSIESISPLS